MCRDNDYDRIVFKERPLFGALLFDNVSSDARDHAANERSEQYNEDGLAMPIDQCSIPIVAEAQHIHGSSVGRNSSVLSFEEQANRPWYVGV